MANNTIKFYRGLENLYNPVTHANGIYFATDTKKIIMNGVAYGGDSDKKVADVTLNTENNSIVISYTDSTSTTLSISKATTTIDGLMSKEDKVKLDNLSPITVVDSLESESTDAALSAAQGKALKASIDNLASSAVAALSYKGTKDTYEDLPLEENKKGDVWNVVAAHENTPAGTNYAWDGTSWDPLGGTVDLSSYYTKTQVNEAINTVKTDIESNIEDKQDVLTEGEAISITEANVIDVKIDPTSDLGLSKSENGLKLDLSEVKGSNIKVGTAITGGVEINAEQTIAAGMQALSSSIQTAVSGGITSLTSPNETILITGEGITRGLSVNMSNIVATSSSIKLDSDNKLDLFWTEIE